MPIYNSLHYITHTAVITIALITPAIAMPINMTTTVLQPQNNTGLLNTISSEIQELGTWGPTIDIFINFGGFVLDAILKCIQIYFAKEQLKAFLRE